MSLLEVITKASATADQLTPESNYPIVLDPDPILLNLKSQCEDSNDSMFVKRVEGWEISQLDTEIIELGQKFYKTLKIKLKNPKSFGKVEFISMLNSYLEKKREKVGVSIRVDPMDEAYTSVLIQNVGILMGQAVAGLVLDACIVFGIWDVLETLIVNGLVEHLCSTNLVLRLIEKRRSDLVCLCVKHVKHLQVTDVLSILKFFLFPPKGGYSSMAVIRKDWERQALLAIEMATDRSLGDKKLNMAKDASVLLMIAHDGFSAPELCLHHLLASTHVDDVIFSACVSKLNGSEIMGFVLYLKKWLQKYEKFPQACPCRKASSMLGLKACEWVPSLENVVRCLGMVLDEHFSSLIMHPEFREVLKSIELVVSSLASEARLCCTLANLSANLRTDVRGFESLGF